MKLKVLAILLFFTCLTMKGQSETANMNIEPVIEDIIRSYQPWTSVEFNGKLRNDKLPISPTVKIYMIKDSLVQISLRAPFVGEVGRLELSSDELLIVNKMKKTYTRESASNLMQMYPGILSDIQSVFLARVTVFGTGQLDYSNFGVVSVQPDKEGGWILIPESSGLAGLTYGYVVGANSRTQVLDALIKGYLELEVAYTYNNRAMQMLIDLNLNNKKIQTEFDFSSVKWGGTIMSPIKLDNYLRLGIKDFLKSI